MTTFKQIFFLSAILIGFAVHAQETEEVVKDKSFEMKEQLRDGELVQTHVEGTDTMPIITLPLIALTERKFESDEEMRAYHKLRRRIIKMKPYYTKAITLMDELDKATSSMDKKRHRKKYIKRLEKQLDKEFRDQLTKESRNNGRVLVEMIERDRGKSMHNLIKETKSGFRAFWYHRTGKAFGYDLKEGFDKNKDRESEWIDEIMTALEEAEELEKMGIMVDMGD